MKGKQVNMTLDEGEFICGSSYFVVNSILSLDAILLSLLMCIQRDIFAIGIVLVVMMWHSE